MKAEISWNEDRAKGTILIYTAICG